jgi:hypothetical protein
MELLTTPALSFHGKIFRYRGNATFLMFYVGRLRSTPGLPGTWSQEQDVTVTVTYNQQCHLHFMVHVEHLIWYLEVTTD